MNKKPKYLIFGADSILARTFINVYRNETISYDRNSCDITNPHEIYKVLIPFSGKYVINCAAITDIELCEKNPAKAFNVNGLAPSYILEACQKYNKKLIHISTDYAFKPRNIYGWSKLFGEKLLGDKSLIIRTNFYSKKTYIVNNLLQGKKTNTYINMFINPVSINRVAFEIFNNKDKSGIINVFSKKKISWYKFAKLFCDVFLIDKKRVLKTKYKNHLNKARRPLSSVIDSDINVDITHDLIQFKSFINNYGNKR